ncbi:MAG: hypothetical protein RMM58_10875 [Chloroflexota bacterium]|nr:hypothetical protein [Dehalococcoidia bacterium]MDW8254369.1 hypothetical protein [Chloroflexota bacterium]
MARRKPFREYTKAGFRRLLWRELGVKKSSIKEIYEPSTAVAGGFESLVSALREEDMHLDDFAEDVWQFYSSGWTDHIGGEVVRLKGYNFGDGYLFIAELGYDWSWLCYIVPPGKGDDAFFENLRLRWIEESSVPSEPPWNMVDDPAVARKFIQTHPAAEFLRVLPKIPNLQLSEEQIAEIKDDLESLWNTLVETTPPPTGEIPGLHIRETEVPDFRRWAEQHTVRWRDTGEQLSISELETLRCYVQYACGSPL